MSTIRSHHHIPPSPKTGAGSSAQTDSLRLTEEVFRAIFEEAGIGMALVDLEGRPLAANRRLEEILGYTEQELRLMTFPEFTHPEDVRADSSRSSSEASGPTTGSTSATSEATARSSTAGSPCPSSETPTARPARPSAWSRT